MKNGIAMMLAALLKAKTENIVPSGDIVFAALSDEEAGGDFGAKFLVENHMEEFEGIRYAIGEFGGCPIYFNKKKFYAIQVAEKQVCWLKAKITGPGGHGAIPMQGGAMAKAARLLEKLDRSPFPPCISPIARQMIETIASNASSPTNFIIRQLLNPLLTGILLKLFGERGKIFRPLLYNTVNPTIIRGGSKVNVIPSEISIQMDARLVPGYTPADLMSDLQNIAGKDVAIEIVLDGPASAQPDMGLYDLLCDVLQEADPDGIPLPMLLPGATDGRIFSELNIQTYGFTPMNLPPDILFFKTVHAADERIPVDSVRFGTNAIFNLINHYGKAKS